MIDASIIRDSYAKMADEQLVDLLQKDGADLTAEALAILHEEFLKRNLDTSVFGGVDDNKTARRKRNIEKAQESASNTFMNTVWEYALDEKKLGKDNEEIHKGLLEMGLDEQHADLIIKTLGNKAKEILDAHDTNMLAGGITFFAGFLITAYTYSQALNGGTYIIAWGAVIFGVLRFFKGMANKDKYKTIIANIEAGHKTIEPVIKEENNNE